MITFLSTIIAAFIGASLSPLLSNFFQETTKRINNLKKAYLLLGEFSNCFRQLYRANLQLISPCEVDEPYSSEYIKRFESVFPSKEFLSELHCLLDFDLNYPGLEALNLFKKWSQLNLIYCDVISCFMSDTHERCSLEELKKFKNESESLEKEGAALIKEIKKWCKFQKENATIQKVLGRKIVKLNSRLIKLWSCCSGALKRGLTLAKKK